MKTFTIKSILIIILIIITSTVTAKNQDKKNKLRWDEKTVQNYMNTLKPPDKYKRTDNEFINIITNTAIANNIVRVPTNLIDFVARLFDLPVTNESNMADVFIMVKNTTNAALGDFFLDRFTNYYGEHYKIDGWEYDRDRSQTCLWAINNIATPELIDKLNKAWIVVRKRDPFNLNVYPCFTINPDRFPKESEDWLFNSPYVKVRKRMVNNWLQSKRPEKIEILRRYIKKLEKTPKLDPIFTLGLRSYDDHNIMKRMIIKTLENLVAERERQYRRWLEDKKRMPLDYGVYHDGHWEKYNKMSEEERKKIYRGDYKPESKLTKEEKELLKNKFKK